MPVIMRLACVLMLVGWGMPTDAQERKSVLIHGGFMGGEDCHRSSDDSMAMYMAGVVNGLLVSPFLGAPETRMKPLSQCLTNVTSTQLAATLKKWLKENPERWHEGCHLAAFLALRQICGGL